MNTGIELDDALTHKQDSVTAGVERRRPGRPEHVSPALLPLLRGDGSALDPNFGSAYPDQLSAVRGIAVALVLSALVAGACVAPVLLLLR